MAKVITISREFGSGGHDIGVEVAKRLNIHFMIMKSWIRLWKRADLREIL